MGDEKVQRVKFWFVIITNLNGNSWNFCCHLSVYFFVVSSEKTSIYSLVVNCGRSLKREYAGEALRGVSRLPTKKSDWQITAVLDTHDNRLSLSLFSSLILTPPEVTKCC